jgi:hypothetical protein
MTSNGKDLQLQRQTEMLTRRPTVTRTAFEMISKGQWAPELLKTAREALDTLDGLDGLKIFYRKNERRKSTTPI